MVKEEKVKEVEREIIFITIDGKELSLKYEIDESVDDWVLEEVREALFKNTIYFSENLTFGDISIMELDMKKIIGISWY